LQGVFLILDCFEPVLPDFTFYNVVWANRDKPNFVRYKNSDRFFTLACGIFEQDSEKNSMALIDFYKSLRGIKNESEVWEKWKNAKLREPAKPSDFLIKADILCRAGKFDKAFKLVEKYHEAKITAAYRICNSIIHHCKQQQLKDKVAGFMDEKELFQKAFCAELSEIADIADNDKKSCWL
jgi:pentatricopeptide repeat protein